MTEFAQLLGDQIPKLRRYARALTRNVDAADDLVQDTLVRAVAKQALWQEGTNLRAWLFTLMHNQHVNDVRRNVRTGEQVAMDSASALSLTATTDPTGSRQLSELERALDKLPMEQRQVILLIGLEGMSYEDAAAICSVPIGTVRSRLSRGRVSLRLLLDMDDTVPAPAIAAGRETQRALHVV